MLLAVLNPGGRDPRQQFSDGAGVPGAPGHPPVNFHAYAACTSGSFHRTDETIPADCPNVLVMVRHDIGSARQALLELRRTKKAVAISLKESGAHQIAALLAKPARLKAFRELCDRAAGAVASTPDASMLYRGFGVRRVEYIPTPYPVEDPRWDFSVPVEERRGIWIGTREFHVPSRNHLAALLALRPLAEGMGEPVTVCNADGWTGRRLLRQLRFPEGTLRVIEGRLPYAAYLREMARHRIVFQLDASAVPGQVAGDALLCRVPCVGGDGAVERLAWADTCGHGRDTEGLFDMAARLLEHPHDCASIVERAMERARVQLSFSAAARALENFYRPLLPE